MLYNPRLVTGVGDFTMPESLSETPASTSNMGLRLICSWLVVGIPLAWGIWETLKKSLALFE
jgi:hypothetical protein